ncbi:MAG: GDSL-type esterase/lipase family protein [Tenericutes bacterium]|nr:GDSL-type esterase/lipase family protein [Mycoplasmatota bacterium]MDD6941504.1 GDSL-type esterase/lipase family protein [bacterium]MDY2696810.1 GDSL-type esterase/lipase family protein [Bacilli bacterium]
MSKNKNKKKNNSKYVSTDSKYSRYEKLKDNYDDLDLSKTQQQQLVFDDVDLDATINLDTSFMEKKDKKKVKKIVDEVVPVPKVDDVYEEKNKSTLIIVLLTIACLFFISFIAYHYLFFDHSEKVKVVTKKEEVVEKVVDNNYLFLGDSITEQYDLKEYYEDYPVVNSGVSGDFTSSIVENMKKRVYDYNPSKVFLLIGINDLRNGKDVSEIVSNTKEIIELIKENRPYSEIYLESIYPINKTDDDKISDSVRDIEFDNEKIIEVNDLLKDLAKDEKITYVDLYNKLIDDDGNLNISYTKDGLHISSEGYECITKELMKYIKD